MQLEDVSNAKDFDWNEVLNAESEGVLVLVVEPGGRVKIVTKGLDNLDAIRLMNLATNEQLDLLAQDFTTLHKALHDHG